MSALYSPSQPLKVATSFSGGFGSVELALKYENIPHEVVFACEWKDKQRESYVENHGEPTSNFYKDIRDFDGTKYKGQIDYYHLSPPCQSYSFSGNRKGLKDERGGLMLEAIRTIDEVQPKMFTVENVRGLLNSNKGEDWRNILRDFNSLDGYTISWGVVNAKEQGTPQNRERVFIIGFRANALQMPFPGKVKRDKCLADLLEKEVDSKYYLSEKTLKGFIAHKNKMKERGNGFGFSPTYGEKHASSITTKAGSRPDDNFIIEELIHVGNVDQKGHNSLWGRVYDPKGIASTQNANGGGLGAKTGLYIEPVIAASRGRNPNNPSDRNSGGPISQRLEFNSAGITNAITTVQKDNYLVLPKISKFVIPKKVATIYINGVLCAVRKLTPRECARVMGDFDDKFKIDGFLDTKLYEFIGNAIDVNTIRRLIVQMLNHAKDLNFTTPLNPSFNLSSNDGKGQASLFDFMEVVS